jgi:hypothetical protein
MSYLGIERCGPILTPEEIEAQDNISAGRDVRGYITEYMCRECLESFPTYGAIAHKEKCKTGKILRELARRS